MTPDRLEQVNAVFNSILDHKAEDRPGMIDAIRRQDPDLYHEVEKLLLQSTATWDIGQNQFEAAELSKEDMNELLLERYRLDRELGRGGFAVVYLAYDERLHRKPVVVKFLTRVTQGNEWFRKKFESEIEALARIDHSGVVGILDAGKTHTGTPFLVMQYAEGVTLRSLICPTGMDPIRTAQIVRQIGQALAAAHSCGVFHRDLKPENIMVQQTPHGELVRLIDFGIATVRAALGSSGDTTRVVGTPSYMAPEQLRGHASAASDIFAMGVIAWEMLFGERSFADEPIKARDADNVKLGRPIAIIRKALSLEPSVRYQNACAFGDELAQALAMTERASSTAEQTKTIRQIIPTPWHRTAFLGLAIALIILMSVLYWSNHNALGAITSIAVLPITNSGSDPNLEYVSDGITETLINSLSGIRTLKVMSRSAVFRFRGNKISPLEQGKALHVDAILTGTMRNISGQIELDVELVEVNTGRQLWGELYRQPTSDLLRLQQSVIEAIAAQLRVQLDAQEKSRFAKDYTANVDAYRLYLQGRYEWNKRSMDGYQKAADYFRQAIDQDPTYALAYSGLADANSYQVGLRVADEIFPAARTAATKAIELDSSLAEGHASLGFILLHYDWDWAGAERQLRIALDLNPNYASAHSTYGRLLSATARFREAEAEILKAQQLDPLSLAIANGLAFHYYLSRRYNLAENQFRRNLSIDPASTHTMSLLAYNYLQQNRLPDAIHQYEQLLANNPDDLDTIPDLARAYASAGRKSDSLYLLARLQEMAKKRVEVLPTFFAEVYAASGELDKAFAYLDKAYRERTWQLIFLSVDPVWDPLRGDARFKQLLGKMGL